MVMKKLTDIKGIGPATIKILQERKIKTVEALASLSLEELRKIPGFKGELRARAVRQAALDSLKEKPAKPASTADSSTLTVTKKTVIDQTVSLPKADKAKGKDKDKDKDEKKARKDDKKAVKDKEKKKKHKDKKKDGKKKDKKKS
ncbi:Helix-hairpin-helix domain-containing protein [Nitrosomonas oligotropha]|uniref:Helix-hairpin-helix domain-containing protein n=2 Tax=Nitrosomonas oligotropha TaxID=42354 RepID=A0A1H8Q8Z3_9PROT|nr:Helix-hairpin-helix domain-containing protein [Nitrosomonas oligotropha]SEO50508.1 Helix-hairpin-helix domain-containing protein [Nitrosomonas oligotropha]